MQADTAYSVRMGADSSSINHGMIGKPRLQIDTLQIVIDSDNPTKINLMDELRSLRLSSGFTDEKILSAFQDAKILHFKRGIS